MAVVILVLGHRLTTLQSEAKAEDKRTTQAELAKASTAATNAEVIAETERAARIKIEERLRPRRLSEQQFQLLKSHLSAFPNTPYELGVNPVTEALSLLVALDLILRESGWKYQESAKTDFRMVQTLHNGAKVEQAAYVGLVVGVARSLPAQHITAAANLVQRLKEANIDAAFGFLPESDPSPNAVHIMVGSKE